jgi:hypothetical protein
MLNGEVEVTGNHGVFKMKSKLLLSVAAPALAALAFFTTAEPASAQWWGYRGYGWGAGAIAAGIVGGAIAAATWAPAYSYGYGYGYPYGYSYGYAPGYSSYGYGYSTAYGYGPSYSYGYNYSPGYYWGNAYGSAGRVTTVRRHRHVVVR